MAVGVRSPHWRACVREKWRIEKGYIGGQTQTRRGVASRTVNTAHELQLYRATEMKREDPSHELSNVNEI